MRTTSAVRLLAYVPDCTNAVIALLENKARLSRDGSVSSDLAAAYAIRAERTDDPTDLVRALDAAETAVQLAPTLPEALFNRAIAEEALGFSADAIRFWEQLAEQQPPSGWTREARQHHDALIKARTLAQAKQWTLNEKLIPEAVSAGDRAAVDALVTPYTAAAQHYVENKLLREWASATAAANRVEANEHLTIAHVVADSVARYSKDRYLLDVVEAVEKADSPAKTQALVTGHLAFGEARDAERQFRNEKTTAALCERAERAFAAGGSPLRFGSMILHAPALVFAGQFDKAYALLDLAEAEARRRHYPTLLARIYGDRGFAAMMRGRLLDSAAEYADAEVLYANAGDTENATNVVVRHIGTYRLIGNHQLAWREAFRAQGRAAELAEPQSRHILLGECALSALDLGFPRVALRYQDQAVQSLREDLTRNPDDETMVGQIRTNLSIALRARAALHAQLHENAAAQDDLREAFARIGPDINQADAAILNGLRARLAEAEAQTLEPTNRKAAIAALTQGIKDASRTQFSSLMASLLVQRARLYRFDRNFSAEVNDLRDALAALAKEEGAMLHPARQLDKAELMWSPYFSRYQNTYRRLIQRLVEQGQDRDAFAYAERARAFEPLNLILKRSDVPPDFQARIHNAEPFRLADIEQTLPLNTFLLEYCVLDDRTYVWIVRRGESIRTTLNVGNETIARWTADLQRFGAAGAVEEFDNALDVPSKGLIEEPLARIAKLTPVGTIPKVVIVPDRAMHGLPFSALKFNDRYVIEHAAISVAPSATIYAFSIDKDRQRAATPAESVLIVADPKFNPRLEIAAGLHPLEAARMEATHIRRLYEPLLRVDPLPGRLATIDEFLRLARTSSIIHIAAHGVANSQVPSHSFLLLAPGAHDSGALDATRLLTDLHLERARLAVVAACSSAGGTTIGPEGLAPLVRPLITAGVPGVVGTLWNVRENTSTAEILVRFHRRYRDGLDADEALRLAQLDMLHDRDLSRNSVLVWAPFQMIGFASSPFGQHARR